METSTPKTSFVLALLAFAFSAASPSIARAGDDFDPEDDGTEVILPVTNVDPASEVADDLEADAIRAEAAHEAWVAELAAHPENKLLRKAEKRNAFAAHPEKMRCWIAGFSGAIGLQTGVCKSAGRKYAMSALALGPAADVHAGRIRLVADRPFPDDRLGVTGGHTAIHLGLGYDAYYLTNAKSGIVVKGGGLAVGLGGGVEFVWVTLTRMDDAPAPTPAPAADESRRSLRSSGASVRVNVGEHS